MPLSLLTYGSIPDDPLIPPRSTWNQETYSASAGIHLAQPQVCRFKIVQGKWSLYFQSTQPIFFNNFWHISRWFLPLQREDRKDVVIFAMWKPVPKNRRPEASQETQLQQLREEAKVSSASLGIQRVAIQRWALMSSPPRFGWFWFIYRGDEILPRYVGMIIYHEIRIPFKRISNKSFDHCSPWVLWTEA